MAWAGFVFGIATLAVFSIELYVVLAFALWVLLAGIAMLTASSPASQGAPRGDIP